MHIYTERYTHRYIQRNTQWDTLSHIHVLRDTYIDTHTDTQRYTHIYIYTHIYMEMCTHTHTTRRGLNISRKTQSFSVAQTSDLKKHILTQQDTYIYPGRVNTQGLALPFLRWKEMYTCVSDFVWWCPVLRAALSCKLDPWHMKGPMNSESRSTFVIIIAIKEEIARVNCWAVEWLLQFEEMT